MNRIFYLSTGFILGYSTHKYTDMIKQYYKPIVFKGYKYYVITSEKYQKIKDKYMAYCLTDTHPTFIKLISLDITNKNDDVVPSNIWVIPELKEPITQTYFSLFYYDNIITNKIGYTTQSFSTLTLSNKVANEPILSASLVCENESVPDIDVTDIVNSLLQNDGYLIYVNNFKKVYNSVFNDTTLIKSDDYAISYIDKNDFTRKVLKDGVLMLRDDKLIQIDSIYNETYKELN